MSHQTKVNNSFLQLKIKLRIDHLPDKQCINVLDAFAGDSIIWDNIKKITGKKINVLGIDKENKAKIQLKGDNLKFLKSIDLSNFDLIDLDAYGVPYNQLKIIFSKNIIDKTIFITFIQTGMGGLPFKMLNEIGIPDRFIKKIKTIFYRRGFCKFRKYLALHGVKNISYYSLQNKYYIVMK